MIKIGIGIGIPVLGLHIICIMIVFIHFPGKNGIAIIVDNTQPESCGLQMEHHGSLQSLECADEPSCLLGSRTEESSGNEILGSFFKTTFGFLVMSFNNLTPEVIHALLSGVMEAANYFDIRAFALVILSKRKKLPIQKILDRFSGPDVTDKPKMFVFQTMTGDTDVQDLSLPPNSLVLNSYLQNTDQIPESTTQIMQTLNELSSGTLSSREGYCVKLRKNIQSNQDTFFVLPNLQSDQNK